MLEPMTRSIESVVRNPKAVHFATWLHAESITFVVFL